MRSLANQVVYRSGAHRKFYHALHAASKFDQMPVYMVQRIGCDHADALANSRSGRARGARWLIGAELFEQVEWDFLGGLPACYELVYGALDAQAECGVVGRAVRQNRERDAPASQRAGGAAHRAVSASDGNQLCFVAF